MMALPHGLPKFPHTRTSPHTLSPRGPAPAEDSLDEREIQSQLEKILSSPQFRTSSRMRRFLSYVVGETLVGRAALLKEYAIAIEVFDRSPAFDPKIDPVVRVEARRLREKLAGYYRESGVRDQVLIEIPKGGYAAHCTKRREDDESVLAPNNSLVTVQPFAPLTESAEPLSEALLFELVDQLTRVHGIRVNTGSAARQPDSAYILSGCVQRAADRIRVVANATETQSHLCYWSTAVEQPFSTNAHETIASAIARSLAGRLRGNRMQRSA